MRQSSKNVQQVEDLCSPRQPKQQEGGSHQPIVDQGPHQGHCDQDSGDERG